MREPSLDNYLLRPVQFKTCKVEDSTLLWRIDDPQYWNDLKLISPETFLERYSYANNKSPSFVDIKFDKNKVKHLTAEQYGGDGVSKNGGGARCGNIDCFQLKGIGVNPLLGTYDRFGNSNGIYSVHEALREIIYTMLFDYIFPGKVVKILGLINLGESTHADPSFDIRLPLVISVREKCVRPAHFFRAPHFEPRKEDRSRIVSDIARVRYAWMQLSKELPHHQQAINLMYDFLSTSAEMFARAFIHRFAHGAISPSNLSITGKWLDLTNASFINGCQNYQAAKDTIAFSRELDNVFLIANQFLVECEKYCQTSLEYHRGQLYFYYFTRLLNEKLNNLPELFGLDCVNQQIFPHFHERLLTEYTAFLMSSMTLSVGAPGRDFDSSVLDYIVSRFHEASARKGNLYLMLEQYYHDNFPSFKDFESSLIFCFIRSVKRIIYSRIFMSEPVQRTVYDCVAQHHFRKINELVNQYGAISKAMFDKNGEQQKLIVIDAGSTRLMFDKLAGHFEYCSLFCKMRVISLDNFHLAEMNIDDNYDGVVKKIEEDRLLMKTLEDFCFRLSHQKMENTHDV
ncbi:hypothetical protein [Cellvibrio japonicus]|uniref:Uncharacterized protein n=1 Tax=Cellvibrio japonicus (strain Ueda107) TaxID=498211 RepID=B3PH08_CELJU|nr:hypothetical protein [Cellvibrio japonicus]ACE84864.1 hypothetical protein CJA_3603 [Cellvibrio japonicus Ueda107]QEI13807.1 hypothetical protein FY117_17375 [Cellvibrio japonicus]QEI17381.1 hypothetical protein FY116_17380 [Cellvibrio japonicus]QEI20957.1 hypothetical protein FY115_17375 [Cellvibrio japonicus]